MYDASSYPGQGEVRDFERDYLYALAMTLTFGVARHHIRFRRWTQASCLCAFRAGKYVGRSDGPVATGADISRQLEWRAEPI